MIIDAHQHVWDLTKARYDWLSPAVAPIDRTIEFAELRPHLAVAGVDRTVLVQSADDARDTDEMLRVAEANPEIAGVVVYVPLDRPEEAEQRLAQLRLDPRVVGVRNLIHDQPDPDWIIRPDVDEGLGVLERVGVPFDYVAVLPRHLENLPGIVERHPDLRIVIDHLGKPPIGAAGVWAPGEWERLISHAGEARTVFGKISGLYATGHDPAAWTVESVRPVVEIALDRFGVDRLMYGGDWPVSILAGGYARVWEGLNAVADELLDADGRAALFCGTATRFYGLSTA